MQIYTFLRFLARILAKKYKNYDDFFIMLVCLLFLMFANHLQVKTERTEAVVAADHRTHGVLHPSVVEVALTTS